MKSLFTFALVILICGSVAGQDTINFRVARVFHEKGHRSKKAENSKPGNELPPAEGHIRHDGNTMADMAIKSPFFKEQTVLSVRPLLSIFTPEELKNKAIVLVFWSAEVPESSYDFADLGDIFKEFRNSKDVIVIALTRDDKPTAAAKLKQHPLLFAEHVNRATLIMNAYRLDNTYPAYVITDKQHVIRYAVNGYSKDVLPDFRSTLKSVLK